MSAEVTLALIGVLVLFTYAAFRYVPMVLDEGEHEEPGMETAGSPELPENFAD